MAFVSETHLTVRYAETDMMGIVHHSRYYPWFEVARTDFIKKIGMSYTEMEKMGIMLPLTETAAKYYYYEQTWMRSQCRKKADFHLPARPEKKHMPADMIFTLPCY